MAASEAGPLGVRGQDTLTDLGAALLCSVRSGPQTVGALLREWPGGPRDCPALTPTSPQVAKASPWSWRT